MLYGIACALEELPVTQPVVLRGSIESVCQTAKKTGYSAIELHVRDPKRYNTDEINKITTDFGLSVCAVANGMEYTVNGLSLIDENKNRREAAVARIFEHVNFAAALNAKLIVGIMRGNVPRGGSAGHCLETFAEVLVRICEYAAKMKTEVVLESILRYINNYLCSVKETMDFITSINKPNLSLHIDTHSMAIEERSMRESILYCMGKPLGYVHYSDNNRCYPGGGALDFREITNTLMRIGYRGFITAECLPFPNPEECAKRAFDYMKSVEKIIGIENETIANNINGA